MSMTEQEARSKCPMGQEECEGCQLYMDSCDGKERFKYKSISKKDRR